MNFEDLFNPNRLVAIPRHFEILTKRPENTEGPVRTSLIESLSELRYLVDPDEIVIDAGELPIQMAVACRLTCRSQKRTVVWLRAPQDRESKQTFHGFTRAEVYHCAGPECSSL